MKALTAPTLLCIFCLGYVASAGAQAPKPTTGAPAVAPSASFPRLGTLILDARQRRELDLARQIAAKYQSFAPDGTPIDFSIPEDDPAKKAKADAPVVAPAPAKAASEPKALLEDPTLTIDGVVVRPGNRSTVWINNSPVYAENITPQARQRLVKAGVATETGGNLVITAKPGQVIDTQTGQRVDLLPAGAIKINRKPAAR